jgi:hypothetical protein
MPHVLRRTLALAVAFAGSLCAEPSDNSPQYRQDDTSYYLKSDVLRAHPDAVIVAPGDVTDLGNMYLVPGRKHRMNVVYLQQMHDWIEPITPPSLPKSLDIPPNAMQVREPQGNVQVALPGAPADFHSVDRGMTLPNGSVLKTGDDGSVAVLFGGVDSVRLAPDSQAAVQMTVTPGHRDAEVDIQSGIVFSKVGQRVGEKESYAVKTPFGTATAHGTDFVTVVLAQRVDVWVAEGTVGLESPIGQVESAQVEGNGPFKVMRFPAAHDEKEALAESAESLTTILNFIPLANQKLKKLEDRRESGDTLSSNETEYIARIRKIPALIRLALIGAPSAQVVAPPAPVTLPPPRPVVPPLTAISPAPFSAPKPAPHEKSVVKAPSLKAPAVKIAESTKHAPPKPTVAKIAVPSKPKVAKERAYPRAKPLTPAEIAHLTPPAPVVPIVHVTATKPRVAETSDPNSLGAPINPYGNPAALPAITSKNASTPSSTPSKPAPEPATNASNNTTP